MSENPENISRLPRRVARGTGGGVARARRGLKTSADDLPSIPWNNAASNPAAGVET
jgi:hypothetical protein